MLQHSTFLKGLRFELKVLFIENAADYGQSVQVFPCLYCVALFFYTHLRSREHMLTLVAQSVC